MICYLSGYSIAFVLKRTGNPRNEVGFLTIAIDFWNRCFILQLRMVALNLPMTGRMLSVRGADERCWQQAREANLTGIYRAFISNRFQHIYTIVHQEDRNLPVGNLQVRFCKKNLNIDNTLLPILEKKFTMKKKSGKVKVARQLQTCSIIARSGIDT